MYPLASEEGIQLIETLEADSMVADSPVGGEVAAIDEEYEDN